MSTGNFELDRYMQRITEQLSNLQGMQEKLTEMSGAGEAAHGLVQVTVGPGGGLTELYLDPRIMRYGSVEVSEAIMEASRAAAADLAEKTNALVAGIDTNIDLGALMGGAMPSMEGLMQNTSGDDALHEALGQLKNPKP